MVVGLEGEFGFRLERLCFLLYLLVGELVTFFLG